MDKKHHIIRTKTLWASYGKRGNPDYGIVRWLLIKDIHDDHLERIIPFIEERRDHYTIKTLKTMLDEQEYRRVNKIRIPFRFG